MDNQDYGDIIEERRKRIFSFRNLLFLIISLVIIYFFLKQIDVAGTLTVISNIKISYILIIFLLYCLSNYLKSLRFMLMLKDKQIKHSDMFTIVSYQNFFNLILPARTGELTLIYYLKKIGGLRVSTGLHSLLLSRFMDLMVVAVIFIISSYFYWGRALPLPLLVISLIILSGSLLLVFRLGLMLNLAKKIIETFTKLSGLRDKKIIQKGIDLVDKFRDAIPEYNSKTDYFLFIAVTVVIWINFYIIF
ncbi:MAG: flippase-like domain-containing protein, partial [Spirochaetes bacterium]|nr:flippase-like domain-containing protein [Spirochaetota bacterium]